MNRRNFIKTTISSSIIMLSGCITNSETNYELLNNSPSPLVKNIQDRPNNGSDNAQYSMISIDDPSCTFCATFKQESYPEIEEKLINTGEMKHYSLIRNNNLMEWSDIGIHYLITLYNYTYESNAYFDLLDYYYENQDDLTESSIYEDSNKFIKNNYSVNISDIESDVRNKTYKSVIEEQRNIQDAVGLSSTPSFALFNGGNLITELTGAYETETILTLIQN